MVGYITSCSRCSTAAQREVAPLCLYICCHHFFVHLHRCVGVTAASGDELVIHERSVNGHSAIASGCFQQPFGKR